jgi:predicted GTPase
MKKIYIKYNPYKVETEIRIEGKEPKPNSKFHIGNQRLQEWIDDLPKMLLEECNTRDVELVFYGTTPDYEDVLAIAEEAIQEVFNKIQNGPFEELKKPNITRAFELAKSSEFEVDVVATMSAGKSTLINALLGQKLMPSKNEACTAIITEIKDNGEECFKAKVYDKKGKLIKSYNGLDLRIMKNLNDNENVSKIRTEGNIPFVTSEDTALVLVDTPGPNNARNPEHRITTQKMLSESSKALVLYIMNATSMGSYDDHRLLRAVAESMKVGGKQSRDRFIFVVNKLDEFKKGEDNVLESLAKVRSYLEDNGIENPNVYPASALTALDIRTILKQEDADDDDDDVWDAKGRVKKFTKNTERYFEKYAPLSTSVKNKIEDRLDKAINNKDVNEQALIHSGVVPIEEAIKIYVTKYANTAKIKNIVDTFQGSLESAKAFETARNQIVKDKEHREEIVDKIASIQTKLASGEEAKKFKNKIEKINYDAEIKNVTNQILAPAQAKIREYFKYEKKKMTVKEAEDACKELAKVADRVQVEVQVKLENLVENNLQNQAKKLLETYKQKLQELVEEVKIGDIEIDPFKMMRGEIPNISTIIHESTRTERVETGKEWIENTDKKWYKPWTWFQESGWYRPIMEDRKYIDPTVLSQKFFADIQEALYKNSNAVVGYAGRQAKIIKDYFKGKFEELDEILKAKLEELNNCNQDEKEAAKNLDDSKNKLVWLEDIKKSMDDILEI